MTRAFLGIDLGTSSAKALLLTEAGDVVAKGSAGYPTHSTSDGRVEQSPDDWWDAAVRATRTCVAAAPAGVVVSAMGFSGHMSVLLPLGHDLLPLRSAITIGDARGVEEATWLDRRHGEAVADATGNLPLSAFTLPKLLWFRTHEPSLFARTRVIVGAKDYLRLRATGSLAADPTDGGNTLLVDLDTRTWNTDLIDRLELPPEIVPPLRESLEIAGDLTSEAADELGLAAGLPVITGMADMAASVLGAGMLSSRRVAITLGTSGQITQVVAAPTRALRGRFTYHPHAEPGRCYVMASLFTGGLGLRWFADVIASIAGGSAEETLARVLERAADSEPGARGVTFGPFLTGSGSPDYDPGRRALFAGLGRGHDGGDLARAVLEGVSFSIRHNLEVLARHHEEPEEWVLGGGGMRSALWRRITADATRRALGLLLEQDAGALGTAIAAGYAIGAMRDLAGTLDGVVRLGAATRPSPETASGYDEAYERYRRLVGP